MQLSEEKTSLSESICLILNKFMTTDTEFVIVKEELIYIDAQILTS